MAEATTPRPDVLAMAEKAAKALHHERMKDVCDSIKAHYFWESFSRFSPSLSSQYCWDCGETISSEFDMRRHRGLCDLKVRLAKDRLRLPPTEQTAPLVIHGHGSAPHPWRHS